MSVFTRTTTRHESVHRLLARVKQSGLPARIESGVETFYVLSAEQLAMLLGGQFSDAAPEEHVSAEDFGLTEKEISAYKVRRDLRRQHAPEMTQLDAELLQRLLTFGERQASEPPTPQSIEEREDLLAALEAAMCSNLIQTSSPPN